MIIAGRVNTICSLFELSEKGRLITGSWDIKGTDGGYLGVSQNQKQKPRSTWVAGPENTLSYKANNDLL